MMDDKEWVYSGLGIPESDDNENLDLTTKNVEDKMKRIKKNLNVMNQISQQQIFDEQRRRSQRTFEEMNRINDMNVQNMLIQQQMYNQLYGF